LVAAFPIAGFGLANISANALIGGVAAAAGQIGANVITRQNWYNGVTSSAIAGALAGGIFGGLKGFANTPIDPYTSGFFDGVGSAFQSSLAMMFSFMGRSFWANLLVIAVVRHRDTAIALRRKLQRFLGKPHLRYVKRRRLGT